MKAKKDKYCIFCGKKKWEGAFPSSCKKGPRTCTTEEMTEEEAQKIANR